MASKLVALSGIGAADLDSKSVDDVIRAVMRNDDTPRVFVFAGQNAAGVFTGKNSLLNALTTMIGALFIAVYSRLASLPANTGLKKITVVKNGTGYRLSHASFSAGDSDAFAAAAYNDDSRTTFRTLQDFMRVIHQNESFNVQLATALGGASITSVVIDQLTSELFVTLDTYDDADVALVGEIMQFSYEAGQSTQFGE